MLVDEPMPSAALLQETEEDRSAKEARRKLMIGAILCFLFMIAEIVGGIMAHSLAVGSPSATAWPLPSWLPTLSCFEPRHPGHDRCSAHAL